MLDIENESIGHLLADKVLRVPYFQREYSWKSTHVQELFSDLRRAIDNGGRDYFLGSIVACRLNEGELEIVDGQQRLATTAILFAAMRNFSEAQENTRAVDFITKRFLYRPRSITEADDIYNLTLGESDDAFFRDKILASLNSSNDDEKSKKTRGKKKEKLRDSNRKLREALKVASKHIAAITAGKNDADASAIIQKWIDYIDHKTKIVLVTVDSHEEAYVIFETLNDRGLDLTIADLTKNYLFSKAGDKHKLDEMKSKWQRMVGALETVTTRDLTKQYIHHLWSSLYGVTSDRDVFGRIRAKIHTRADAIEFAGFLGKNAHIYAALRNSDHEFWSQYGSVARQHIRALSSSLRVTQIHILLLAVLSKFNVTEVKRFLPKAVSWSVRFLLAGGPTGNLESAYSSNAVQITKGDITTSSELIASLKKNVPSDDAFKAAFESAGVQTNYLARYYLQCLERVATDQENPHLAEDNEESGSLEHILPQSPDMSVWDIDEDECRYFCRKIGNLALLDSNANSNRGNSSFEDAKKEYAKCETFQLTKNLAEYGNKWGEDQISKRQRELAQYALKAWPL